MSNYKKAEGLVWSNVKRSFNYWWPNAEKMNAAKDVKCNNGLCYQQLVIILKGPMYRILLRKSP